MLSPTFSPERYTHFYLRKDYYDGTYIPALNRYDNLEYGGLAFSGNVYVPALEEIEISKPDPFIYERYKDLFIDKVQGQKATFTSLINNAHMRLSLDGEAVWKNFEKQLQKDKRNHIIYFHDTNLGNIKDAPEAVKYLLEKYSYTREGTASIGTKFPIHCKDYETFKIWNKLRFCDNFFSIQIDNILEDEEFAELISSISPATAKKIRYQVASASSDKNLFIKEQLPKIFKQVIFCCNQHKQISLVVDDNFLINKEWLDVVSLLNLFMSAAVSYSNVPALYRFCKALRPRNATYRNSVVCKEDARELFYYIHDNHQELFKMFYECNKVKLKGGNFCFD